MSAPIKDIGAPISPCETEQYYNAMRENTVTGVTSGRHMGMYKAFCTKIEDNDASEKQEEILNWLVGWHDKPLWPEWPHFTEILPSTGYHATKETK